MAVSRRVLAVLKRGIREHLNRLGFDVIRVHRSPRRTLLGLANLNIRTVIDVGANRGQFARLISGFFPGADIYCFEPLDDPFAELSRWAETQGGRVRCFKTALGASLEEGHVTMHLHEEHTPSSSLLTATETCHEFYPQTVVERMAKVEMSTLDTALAGIIDSTPRDILLKLDVQGFEDRVLQGGERVLSQCRAVITEIVLDPLYEDQAGFYTLVRQLSDAGFRYAGNLDQAYGEDGHVVYLDAVFLRE